MYADNLAVIAESNTALQAMLNLVYNFSLQWHYQLQAQKSAVLVFGQSASSCSHKRAQRMWHIGSKVVHKRDSYHHSGVLRSASLSSNTTLERCGSCRNAFTPSMLWNPCWLPPPSYISLRLYKAYCIPILLYGCELWSLTQSELTLLERTHRKILHTISGMPILCKSISNNYLGSNFICSLIHQRQLNFLHSLASLPTDSLPV